MNPILRNILAVLAGLVVGNVVMMGMIILSPKICPLPEGMIPMDMDSLVEHIGSFTFGNYAMVFLSHALGVLAAAYTAARLAVSNHKLLALLIGGIFILAGIKMVIDIPAPMWYNVVDLVGAYFPMGYLGYLLGKPKNISAIKS